MINKVCHIADMFGVRAVSILLLCLALICHQVQAQAQVFIVKGAGYNLYDGIYAEEGEGSNLRYQRMGGVDTWGKYYYIYRGTERADTWLVGYVAD